MHDISYFIKRSPAPVIGLAILSLTTFSVAIAAPAKKPTAAKKAPAKAAPRPAAKPAPKPTTGPVPLGMTQMLGDFGVLGTTYTIGKDRPINFTLRSAEYSVAPYQFDQSTSIPENTQKILVLHYTIHNPLKEEQNYNWQGIKFTAVDASSNNHEYIQAVQREGEIEGLDINLKPAQKVDVTTAIVVPAKGQIPKLIVQREEGAPVIRYDLRGKVKGLDALYADPADASGATAREDVTVAAGTWYPTGLFLTRLESVAYTKDKLADEEPEEGKRFFTATFTIKNPTTAEQSFSWQDFKLEVKDADGEKTENNQALLKATRNEYAEGNLKPGEETRVRFYFVVPENVVVKTLSLRQTRLLDVANARSFTFPIPEAK